MPGITVLITGATGFIAGHCPGSRRERSLTQATMAIALLLTLWPLLRADQAAQMALIGSAVIRSPSGKACGPV